MIRAIYALLFIAFTNISLIAQIIKVQPYLQDASPHSIFILWETDSNEESLVEWGLTDTLGRLSTGTAEISEGDSRIHTVELSNLEPFTKYFYRARTGMATSDTYSFKTPPHSDHHEPFRFIAMSDMQQDGAFPNKFQEIVEQGIIEYLDTEFGGDITDNLALVLIPGDLVQNGNNYTSWEQTFFDPAQNLFSRIPVYPVPGNHENNAIYFFKYFKLPENGTPGFEEHWWHKDYGNVRFIGLDSNNPFSNQEQLDWLQMVLDSTCNSDSIDFVFAQLHHPHKSELWTPGESNYTGEVINKLEDFSSNCGKPSIHFFGHTHGYSRGNSRDHKHLWINVATAGGAIDNWGEFPNFDYDEFSVSQDEYGFVSVEITDDNNPKITVKRINRGDQDASTDNRITDSLTIRKNDGPVDIPIAEFPVDVSIHPECVILRASEFSSTHSLALHGQSHWQVSDTQGDFSAPIAESWKNFENWYFEENTQANDDLLDEEILGLPENSTFWWRVRYRDRELNWSDWSAEVSFSTKESNAAPNLLLNPGAEDSLSNWILLEGVVESLTARICDGISPHLGNKYFAVGGLCEHSAVARCVQNIDVRSYSDSISMGNFSVTYGGYLSNYSGSDLPEMRLIFFNKDSLEQGQSNVLSTLNPSWTRVFDQMIIPPETSFIQVELKGTRNSGTDNDSYFDDLFLRLGTQEMDCGGTTTKTETVFPVPYLEVVPNPIESQGIIKLPFENSTDLQLSIINSKGIKQAFKYSQEKGRIFLQKGHLSPGIYLFWVRQSARLVGSGKLIIR